METLLRKYLWAIDLAVIALCAMFGARATATIIESSLTRGLPPPARRAPRPMMGGATVYTKQTDEILKRNMFCSTCPPIIGGKEPVETHVDLTPQRTTLPIKLLAIMYAPPPVDPRWSMAIIRDNDEKYAGPYAIGAKIRDATITDIEETRVDLDVHGRKEYLELFEKNPGQPMASAAPTPIMPTAPASDPLMAEMEKGVKKINENTYDVQRGTVDALLSNMSVLSRAARIVPEIKDGKPNGFRLFSVRPDGPFAKIGFQNGDVISAINGLDMSSPDKALEVYTKLRSASHLSVAMERNGQKITKEYSIR